MANTLQIKRSAYDGSTAPGNNAVIAGEMAIAQGNKKLYIGRENNVGGTVEAYHLPLLTDLTANATSFGLAVDSGDANNNSYTLSLASGAAGDGLSLASHALKVNVDDSSIETNSDALRVKAGGVTDAMTAFQSAVMVVSDGSNNSNIAVGGTATFTDVAGETVVTESAGEITIGLATDVIIAGTLTVQGTTTTVNSNTVTVDDPIFTIGGDTAPSSNDQKDRGIEFRWHNGSAAKVGFFGVDESDGKFKYIADATNTSEVFSGSVGSVVFDDVSASTINDATINGGSF